MERRKLTKEDIDKVRDIEGFPIGKDEDIIALSDAPYYTACPNPFIADFIKENGKPYDEATDDYHREPFAADVSASKNDSIYTAHSYHTKVPYKAIMRYILHYTNPGDIVFDGFCGTGMTGVAAEKCGFPDSDYKLMIESVFPNVQWGTRNAIINDLAVAGTHISSNYVLPFDVIQFREKASEIIASCKKEFGWLYETTAPKSAENTLFSEKRGVILNTVWSNVIICPHCGKDVVFYNESVDKDGNVFSEFNCPHCGVKLDSSAEKKEEPYFDELLNEVNTQAKLVPVFKIVEYAGKKYRDAICEFDEDTIARIEGFNLRTLKVPTEKMLFRDGKWGDIFRSGYHKGYSYAHHFYSKRNFIALGAIYNKIEKVEDIRTRHMLMFAFTGSLPMVNKTNRWRPAMNTARGPINGILYIPSFYPEMNVFNAFQSKVKDIEKFHSAFFLDEPHALVTTQSSNSISNVPTNSVDYVFVDPPFGDNIMYSESNFLWETWLKVFTEQKNEAIVNSVQGKKLVDYQELIEGCFSEFHRILKPNRWITVEFHNSKNSVWNAIQQALLQAGFIIADVRTLDKNQGSFKQVTTTGAVKQDLVISAYKPKESFSRTFLAKAGTKDSAWDFVQQHLENLPVVVCKKGKIELIAERQAYLLFDRMVACHIINGITIPLDAPDFYRGLDEKFLKRDGMYFLPDQVNEYDTARIKNDVEPIQFQLFVTNEKSAIAWLYQQLDTPQTYQVLQPKFMQEIKSIDKFEDMPELSVLLEENFLQDDEGKWYIPDVTKEADVAKLREKKLLKEFEGYLATKGKLKLFRAEAVRVGFAKLWADKNYKLIVDTAERLPEQIIQEDDKLLMYYDISLGRV